MTREEFKKVYGQDEIKKVIYSADFIVYMENGGQYSSDKYLEICKHLMKNRIY